MVQSHWLTATTPLIIGHRGASADAPENTLRALRLAREQGADGVEFDVHLSADSIPVLIHDATLQRTTNARGRVRDLPAAALQALDAGDGEPVPTLDQVFEELGRDFLYNVELKAYSWRDQGAERAVAQRIIAHGLTAQVVVSSFDFRVMRRARRLLPPTVPLALIRDPRYLRFTHRFFTGVADHPHFRLVDEAYMAAMQGAGRRVHVWTVDDAAEARRLVQLGVHGLITNRPAALRAALALPG